MKKTEKRYSFYVSSNRIITRFKTIIKESDIAYKDIQNYTLACIDRKAHKLIKTYRNIDDKKAYERKVRNALIEILDFSFFLYAISPKVNSTIKLCMTLSKITKFAKVNGNFNQDNQHQIFKKIYDEIFLVLKKYKCAEHTQVETLYLLIALKELGRDYRIDEDLLCKHYGIDLKQRKCENHLNYFSIVVLLFYIENKKRYVKTKSIIKAHVLEKFYTISFRKQGKDYRVVLIVI
jgi:chromosome condensin MukBEF complex kleisin-like MukF subunit